MHQPLTTGEFLELPIADLLTPDEARYRGELYRPVEGIGLYGTLLHLLPPERIVRIPLSPEERPRAMRTGQTLWTLDTEEQLEDVRSSWDFGCDESGWEPLPPGHWWAFWPFTVGHAGEDVSTVFFRHQGRGSDAEVMSREVLPGIRWN